MSAFRFLQIVTKNSLPSRCRHRHLRRRRLKVLEKVSFFISLPSSIKTFVVSSRLCSLQSRGKKLPKPVDLSSVLDFNKISTRPVQNLIPLFSASRIVPVKLNFDFRVLLYPWCIEFGGAMQMDQRELDEFPSASKQNKSQCYLWSFSKKKTSVEL
ncbi:hypothetical protein Bca52824_079247 [Brassica carinata]|uniref:Uncharacterized protein n=1 Tax=Brassica carinata TaxID=52824 RepID=A0A8X7Q0S3_BRACI|nr:hypothetical protein Bca52824_079247 [Brassica carinata]